ncbi:peptidase [Mycolicibacterium moriokaense]|nr:peptidase [Mycolicibacterium moriokaense]
MLGITGCSQATALDGHAVSMRYDPYRVAGLPTSDGPSGPRTAPASAAGRVQNTDDGPIDREALLAVEDIEDFWSQHYSDSFAGAFKPVSRLVSVDPRSSNTVCGEDASAFDFNALYCAPDDLIAWDRIDLMPVAKEFFGDMTINGLLAHEYGHALQWRAGLVGEQRSSILVREQQADCLAGVYMRWVAEGHSPRYSINTSHALDQVMAGAIAGRDPISTFDALSLDPPSHGTALDRVSAFQTGFDVGADGCAAIDSAEIEKRRGDLPPSLFDPASPQSDIAIDEQTLSTLMDILNQIFDPTDPPTLTTSGGCPVSEQQPVAYCPESNTIAVDLPTLRQIGKPADESDFVLLQGDNTALSMVTSRYALALQHERGMALDSAVAAMRTACLTGVAQRKMADPTRGPSGNQLVLGAGDLDEAVSGLLTNGVVATDVSGTPVPSGFTRILAFRTGLLGDAEDCYQRFP